ncbi:hypothetical protein RCOM_0553000 [Ricinus communis]|uniref:Retrotransposon Copia-like N-terminal domain-containing protein n=1 Tax=Ricinus communis TaxID=3988 RepID=B9SGH3_RICCO|nr:hypothetical protein RCOM_0553000 [Ricinus communis]
MEITLYAKNKGGFVDGSLPLPDPNSQDFHRWKKNYAMVKAWIGNSLAKEIHESVAYVETTREIWLELCERYGQSNTPRIYKIKKEFSNLVQNNSQSLT